MNAQDRRLRNIVIVGHVDHGKSTLIGRLLHETDSLPEGKLAELLASCERRGVPMEWSFVLDALQAERDQAITIDTTRVWFSWGGRRYAIIDAPGHRQFVSNMLSGASEADAAILMVDASEGVSEQTRRHAYLLGLLGIEQVVVAVNKLDLVGFEQDAFDGVAAAVRAHLGELHIEPTAIVPVVARDGDNLADRSPRTPWYGGPTVLEALAELRAASPPVASPLRLRVQDVYRSGTMRIAVGRVDAGSLAVGDTIVVEPTGSTAVVNAIVRWPEGGAAVARAGESIGFTVDRPIYLERGDVVAHQATAPRRATGFGATFFWLDERGPEAGEVLRLQFGPTEARVVVEAIERVVDTETLQPLPSVDIPQYAVVELRLRSSALLPLDPRDANAAMSRCVLLRGADVVGGGFVSRVTAASVATNLHPERHLVLRSERAERNGHRGAIVWLTGLSGSGKSTLAMAVERRLFSRGQFVYVLDGDNVRAGLNRDLGFSAEDRAENIRRVAEVAALFADAGAIVLSAFISPFAKDRALAREIGGAAFHEVFVAASLSTCEARDPKGLYRRARQGEIGSFTGISAPYEAPTAPELVIDSGTEPLDASVERLVSYVLDVTAVAKLVGA